MAGVKKDPNKTYSPNYGGKREGGGRKMLYECGRQQLAISCSKAQKKAIQNAASEAGMTTAAYVLEKCSVAGMQG